MKKSKTKSVVSESASDEKNTVSKQAQRQAERQQKKLQKQEQKQKKQLAREKKQLIKKQDEVRLHHSFKRSYYEDYQRKTELPSLTSQASAAFKMFFKFWKIFLPLLLIFVGLYIFLIGAMSENTLADVKANVEQTNKDVADGKIGTVGKAGLTLLGIISTGGLTTMNDAQVVIAVLLFTIIWLVTIYLARHLLADHQEIKMRDGFYSALSPLVSTLVVGLIIFLEAIPIMLTIIVFQVALTTEFLSTPFYALLFFMFAALMITLSLYLLSSSFFAIIVVSAPGLYPLTAVRMAKNLIMGRRLRFLIRVFYLVIIVALLYLLLLMPAIILDGVLKAQFAWLAESKIPFVAIIQLTITVFIFIYLSIYFYLFYRALLDYNDDAKLEL
jgi:membrane protein